MIRRQYSAIASLIIFLVVAGFDGTKPESFKAEITIDVAGQSVECSILFDSHYAFEYDIDDHDKLLAVFDLEEMSWTEFDPPREVHLKDCEMWNRISVEKSRKSLSKVTDAKLKHFLETMIDPKFEIKKTENSITLENDVIAYHISSPLTVSPFQRTQFFKYDRLNAYRKAMHERKLPPTAQLVVDDEMEKSKFVPGEIEVTIETPKDPIQFVIKSQIVTLNDVDKERVTSAIRRVNDVPTTASPATKDTSKSLPKRTE